MRVAEYPLSMLHWAIRQDPWVRAIFLSAGVKLDELAERILDVSTFEDSEAMMSRSLTLWERILGITPEEDATMDERRANVRAMWLACLPPSIATIQAVCDAWRAGEIEAEYEAGIGTIVLYYLESFGPQDRQGGLVRALDIVKPAHLALEHAWRYLRVDEVHRQMSVAELEQTPRGWFAGYRARLLPGSPREYRRAAGSVVSILSPQAWPLRGCTVEIRPAQEGSGEPSPENVRPISGRTGASLRIAPTPGGTEGTTIALDWADEAGTVYGGTLDVTNGVLTVTHGRVVYDGSETWTALGAGYYRGLSGMRLGLNNADALCDRIPFVVGTALPGIQLGYNGNASPSVYIRQAQTLTGAATAAELKAWLAEHPVEVVYPLAEPYTVQLTPQEVTTLVGRNNIWADCGDVAVEYASAETAEYELSGKCRPRDDGVTAVGDCLIIREDAKVTVRAVGDTLYIGSAAEYEAPAYAQIGDGVMAVDGALTIAEASRVTVREDGDTLYITDGEEA